MAKPDPHVSFAPGRYAGAAGIKTESWEPGRTRGSQEGLPSARTCVTGRKPALDVTGCTCSAINKVTHLNPHSAMAHGVHSSPEMKSTGVLKLLLHGDSQKEASCTLFALGRRLKAHVPSNGVALALNLLFCPHFFYSNKCVC